MKRKLLGYGMFTSAMWDHKNWQFERMVHIQPSKEAVKAVSGRVKHCLHRETRRIYNVTKLNVGTYSRPKFVLAADYLEANKDSTLAYNEPCRNSAK